MMVGSRTEAETNFEYPIQCKEVIHLLASFLSSFTVKEFRLDHRKF